MTVKPAHVFDRDFEWAELMDFTADPQPRIRMGVVSGRRRQGKTYLLQAVSQTVGGFFYVAAEATEAEALQKFGMTLAAHARARIPYRFADWDEAFGELFAVCDTGVIVIDEFPYLVNASPAIPAILQRALGPGGAAARSRARLLLCGSAMSTMGRLLAGSAPLRGRASLEMIMQPFDYPTAAEFWGIRDPRLAVLVHSVVGGTPAYRFDFLRGSPPSTGSEFDEWIIKSVLTPTAPLYREARYLLAEESEIRDPALYHSVLAAIADGNHTRGGIGGYLGRRANELSHPLNVLEDCRLICRVADPFRKGRSTYQIAEPLITFYEAVMRPAWTRLELRRAPQVWRDSRARFLSRVVGPHFEGLCREYAARADEEVFGGIPGEVASGTVADPANRSQIELDVVVFAQGGSGGPRRVLSLGEAKWGEVMGIAHLNRLRRARSLLDARGFDVRSTVLTCHSGTGFDAELREAARRGDVLLVDLDRLYTD